MTRATFVNFFFIEVCALQQHSRMCVKIKLSHRHKETMCIDKNCKKKDQYQEFVLTTSQPPRHMV